MTTLEIARNRFWKIMESTGDYINSSVDSKEAVDRMSLDDLMTDAFYWADNHHSASYDKGDWEDRAAQKWDRFIKRFSK